MRLTLLIFCLWVALVLGQLPPKIEKCEAGDSICVAETITRILRTYPKGLASIGLDALDSISFENVIVSRKEPDGPATLDLLFNNVTVRGFADSTVAEAKGFEADLPRVLELSGWIPLLKLDGFYEMHGSLLTMPIQGRGHALVEIKECRFRCKVRAVEQLRGDGKRYAEIAKVKCLLDVQGMHLNFENLFNNSELSDAMNDVANAKWLKIWHTLRKGITSAVDQLVESILKRVANKLPYDDFYRN
ncbi:circadian clock-controlled protein daywake [Drosophila takahashii]|uniref:circadian clock-controlled protein daywake n=1 Tax=Drosophila takahashii TaxID=29030 RepID=UPI003899181B